MGRSGAPDVHAQGQHFVAQRRRGLVRFRAALEELGLLDGSAVDAPVDGEDDERGQVERADRREQDVALLRVHVAHHGVGIGGWRRRGRRPGAVAGEARGGRLAALLPAEQRPDADGQRGDPHNEAERGRSASGHDRVVIQRARDADVTIHRYDA